MKIALQITTATLGDMVIEEADDKTTTNPDDQKAIVVELLIQALSKVTAAYRIPKDMLDLGDEEYQAAHSRKIEQDKQPRYSSAEANRLAQQVTSGSEEDDGVICSGEQGCNCELKSKPEPEVDDKDEDEEDLIITEEELEFVRHILTIMRGKNV